MDIIKSFLDLGLSGAALVAMIVIIFKLLDLMKAMNEVITKNTVVTEALKQSVDKHNESMVLVLSHLTEHK